MRRILTLTACFALFACGDEKTTSSSGGDTATAGTCDSSLTFESDIKGIVASGGKANCAGCHSSYASLSGFSSAKTAITNRVKSTSSSAVMPQDDLKFKSTDEGKKLLDWLSCETLK